MRYRYTHTHIIPRHAGYLPFIAFGVASGKAALGRTRELKAKRSKRVRTALRNIKPARSDMKVDFKQSPWIESALLFKVLFHYNRHMHS